MKRGWSLVLLGLAFPVQAGELSLHLVPVADKRPLRLDALMFENAKQETFSVERFSLLLSDVSLETEDGRWIPTQQRYAWIDAGARRFEALLGSIPEQPIRSIRFAIGPDPTANASDPTSWPPDHPLNPVLNRLHWDWQSGYIFMALEGRYRSRDKTLKGYVYHFANNPNRTKVTLPARFHGKDDTSLIVNVDIPALLSRPHPISFDEDGQITHAREGDVVAERLKKNLPDAFRLHRMVQHNPDQRVTEKKAPLYLPKTFTPYPFKMNRRFPLPPLPADNPLTTARVELGRRLFNETALSKNGRISCATCHDATKGFSDPRPRSKGVDGRETDRHSMPLFNLAWKTAFFWDGRAPSLRDQVLMPIKSHREMASDLKTVVTWIKRQPDYRRHFAEAFDPPEPTAEKVALALEAFLLTLTSTHSRFDEAMKGKAQLTHEERRGFELFFTEYDPRTRQYGADCFHCHGGSLFSDQQFHNNGLVPNEDTGREQATGKASDRYRFSTPSLRNIALTAPYMHDGRFGTLEEVI
ncbi:MAG: MbnP family protein, partial [Verrucomicrobiota bacterium]